MVFFYYCIKISSILIICRLCICEVTYLLKRVCALHSSTCQCHGHWWARAERRDAESPTTQVPVEAAHGHALPSCFSSHAVSKCPFCNLRGATCFTLQCFWLVIWVFEMAPKPSAEARAGAPKGTRPQGASWRKYVREALFRGGYRAVDHAVDAMGQQRPGGLGATHRDKASRNRFAVEVLAFSL